MALPSDDDADIGELLRYIAEVAVANKSAADALLWEWIGPTPTPQGEERMKRMAKLAPRLLADEVARAGWGGRTGLWAVNRPADKDLPSEVEVATQAAVRHLNGEPDVADEIVDAFTGPRGVQGLWGVGTAALRLLAAELTDQRADPEPRQERGHG